MLVFLRLLHGWLLLPGALSFLSSELHHKHCQLECPALFLSFAGALNALLFSLARLVL
jgi:hypothetical protein